MRKTVISDVTTHLVEQHCYVRVHSEDGAVGTGQSAYFSFPHVTPAVLDALRGVLIGRDPDEIGRLWIEMYRQAPVRGGALTSTISAVDIALWDLKGRRHDLPVYELLGGRQRERVRAHLLLGMRSWPRSATPEELIEEARQAAEEGFTAVKLDPLIEGSEGFHTRSHARRLSDVVELVAAMRHELGDDVDIGLEIHRKLDTAEALALAERLVPFGIYMFEDALPPDSASEWSRLAQRCPLPLGVGERLDSIYEFEDYLGMGVGDFLRPDVGTCGGLTAATKIAALAEARHRRVIAHNFLTPFLSAVTLQLYASVPNVGTFEWNPLDESEGRQSSVHAPLERDGGWISIPDRAGIGIDVRDEYLYAGPDFEPPRGMGTLRTPDGSIHLR